MGQARVARDEARHGTARPCDECVTPRHLLTKQDDNDLLPRASWLAPAQASGPSLHACVRRSQSVRSFKQNFTEPAFDSFTQMNEVPSLSLPLASLHPKRDFEYSSQNIAGCVRWVREPHPAGAASRGPPRRPSERSTHEDAAMPDYLTDARIKKVPFTKFKS